MNHPQAATHGLHSWFEASARQRLMALVDPGSFTEFIGPECRAISPHLKLFDLPSQFDDGIVVGAAKIADHAVLIAAQEGRFMGGSFGEVHGAKLTGLVRAAHRLRRDLVIAFDTGGVRLQEANAGELAIGEIIRAIVEAREAGVRVIGLIGGRAGCFGGGSLIAGCCTTLVISEQGRIGVSGPEVIETNKGVEEFDSRDRALVWRTMGGKHRYLMGSADAFVDDQSDAFRQAAIAALGREIVATDAMLNAEQDRLEERLSRFGRCRDGRDVWSELGMPDVLPIPEQSTQVFLVQADAYRESADDAR